MADRKLGLSRRSFFFNTGAAAAAAGGLAALQDYEAIAQNVQTNSQPSDLKITDLRVCALSERWPRTFVRIDTNQGIHGYGEVRDGSSPTYALMLKSRILGENPCNVDKIFRKIKQFGHHARQAGGPVSIEMACWDLAGKAWGVPCWQMLGGKFRDKIRVYADTPSLRDPVEMGNRLKERINRGYTFLKMDVSMRVLEGIEGTVTRPGLAEGESVDWNLPHPFVGTRLTDKGIRTMADYAARVRDVVGWEIPIATDHYGHFYIEDGIKLARELDPYNLAWLEDMVPWYYTDQYVRLKNSCVTPILTGEDIYLKEGFIDLFEKKAISICHPDLATAGGLLETKKIGDLAMEHGISMALHMAGNPVTLFASVHCAAATENFLVMEHHNVDDEWYDDLAVGPEKPLVQNGYVTVPDTPGLGIELNEDAVKRRLTDPQNDYFPPSDQWNEERSHDRLWSRRFKEPANRPHRREWA